ncbi:MAG TPA: hypothetical protein VH540_17935 [Ktedonobacterales bacterium]|jgi:hypothetical protein
MMNRPYQHPIPQADYVEQDARLSKQQERPSGPLRRLWKFWLRLTTARPEHYGNDLAGQEDQRRSRMLSVLLLLVLATLVLLVPDVLIQPNLWFTFSVNVALGLLAAFLNRSGHVTLAGLALVALVDVGVTSNILYNPSGLNGLAPSIFAIYLIAVLNAATVLSRPWIAVTGVVQMGLIVALFTLVRHDASLDLIIQTNYNGQGYPILVPAILLVMTTTAVAWLYSASVERSLRRASRAEELADAQARIAEQAHQIAEQHQRLEQGINTLQEVHARLSNGDYAARVNLHGNELLPLAVSLNLLAERLGRVGRVQHDQQRLEQAIKQLLKTCAAIERRDTSAAWTTTGTSIDQLAPFLLWVQQVVQHLMQGGTLADELRAALDYVAGNMSHMESTIIGLSSLTSSEISEASELRSPYRSSAQSSSGALRESNPISGGLSQEPRVARLRNLLEQQRALCEQIQKECAQAHQMSKRCAIASRTLQRQLNEGLTVKLHHSPGGTGPF